MSINPIANGNKTAAGTSALAGSSIMGAVVILLPYLGISDTTTAVIIGAAPSALLLLGGIGHKIIKAGGFIGIWRWILRYIIGVQDLKKVDRKVETTSVEGR
jgi:VIT1/CCC1 family predicted Fe2+/Mn2+ transporter